MGMSFQKKRIPGAAAPDPATLEEDHARKGSTTLLDCPTTQDSISIVETPNDNSIETVQADIIPDNDLPPGIYDDICATIDYYCKSHDIPDKKKIHPIEWRAVCMTIGSSIKAHGLLLDRERNKREGGNKYKPEKVLAILNIYDRICSEYKQTAFTHNFPPFAGVSREYFNDYNGKGLTSAQVGLKQKALEIQKASLVSTVNGGGSATVGNIFLSKALAGLQETSTVVHVSSAPAPVMDSVPDLARLGDGSTSEIP